MRVLPPESPEPGPWRSSRTPYLVPIMRAFSDSRYKVVVAVMGAQMGKTECIFNVVGHRFDDGPAVPALYIGPTQKQVQSVSQDRISKMIRSTPALKSKLLGGRYDKLAEKWIGGVRLGFGWAGSATELASHPAGLVLVDERDRMDADVGGEGDPVTMARARTKNYPSSKVGVFSTPTIEGASPIWALWEEGTREMWCWMCPDCSHWFAPRLALLVWDGGDDATPAQARRSARLACPGCGSLLETSQRQSMNSSGRYIPHDPTESGEFVPRDEPEDSATASYWVSGLASPWQSFGEVAEVLQAAKRSGEDERVQAVVNTYGGELWRVRGDAPEWQQVMALRADHQPGQLPTGVQMLTAGVDVQQRGLYYVIRGWGFGATSWLIRHGFIAGETEFDSVWLLLARTLSEPYIGGRRIQRAFVDSGYRPGDRHARPENVIYGFCRRHQGLAFPTKGHDTQDRPLKASFIDVNIGGRLLKNGCQLWHLDSDYLKSWLYGRMRWPDSEIGGWYLHRDVDEDYARQMVSEELIVKPSGRRIWVRRNRANHYLDCESLALAAALSLQVHALPDVERTAERVEAPPTPARAPSRQSFFQTRGNSWFRK